MKTIFIKNKNIITVYAKYITNFNKAKIKKTGTIEVAHDGFYRFKPCFRDRFLGVHWGEYTMGDIAKKLKELNKK